MTATHQTQPTGRPGAARPRRLAAAPRRRLTAAVTGAAIVGAMVAPALALTPAAAADCPARRAHAASAAADLLRLDLLDLHPLGAAVGPVGALRLAATQADLTAGPRVAAAGAARHLHADALEADIAGLVPAGAATRTLRQQAPPVNAEPASVSVPQADLGALRLGIGKVSTHATATDALRCGAGTGQGSTASAEVLSATVLRGPGDQALIAAPANLSSTAWTGLVAHDGRAAAAAIASVSAADLRVLAGTDSQVTVRVISPPTLRVTATGRARTSSVHYDAPVLEISGAGGALQRIDTAGQSVDLPLDDLAGIRSLPLLRGVADPLAAGVPGDGLVVLRLSIGDLRSEIGDRTVRASAASVRLQVLVESPALRRPGGDGYGYGPSEAGTPKESTAVLDLRIGLLRAEAQAPRYHQPPSQPPTPTPAPTQAPPTEAAPTEAAPTTPAPGAGGGCGADCPTSLPRTGTGVGILLGIGALLAIVGRFLLLASRAGRLAP
jgi:hypothetical protein